MPGIVNYSGQDDFYSGSGGSCYTTAPVDSGLMFSIGSHVDVFCPPRKRSRIDGPMVFTENYLQEKQFGIELLPEECLFEIFRRLPSDQERSACACVSKKWLFLLSGISKSDRVIKDAPRPSPHDINMVSGEEDDGHLTRCLEGKKATDVRLAAIAVGISSRGGLGKLSIRGSNSNHGVTSAGLSAIARCCPSLRSFSLWSVSSFGDNGLFEIANGCNMLEKLDLSHCPSVSDKGLISIAQNCPNLISLSIELCAKVGNQFLQVVGNLCPKLQSVSIKGCPLVRDHGVTGLFSSSPALTEVKLQSLNLTDLSLAAIGHYGKAINSLSLYGLQNVSEKGFWVMGSAQGLKKLLALTISSCRGISDVSLEAMGKGFPILKQMCLRKCCFTSDKGLITFLRAAGSLEILQLEECNRVSQLGVIGVLSNSGSKLRTLSLVKCMGMKDMELEGPVISPCLSLRSLSIQNCPGFGSLSVAMVGRLCPQLQNVDFSGLPGLTDAGLYPLLETSEAGLVKVNLSGCINVTDEVVSALVRLHGGTLDLLNLDGCRKVTDASLAAIAGNCLFLRELDVSNCAITDCGIAYLSTIGNLSLQILSLAGCSRVSSKSGAYLFKLGRTLLGLNIQQCYSISSSTIDQLVECLWRCDILS